MLASSPPHADLAIVQIRCLQTALGWLAFEVSEDCLVRLTFGHRSSAAAKRALSQAGNPTKPPEASHDAPLDINRLQTMLVEFAVGDSVDFSAVPIDVSQLTAFGRKVVACCRAIGWGETLSYGQLATAAGKPRAARAVGSVMARNRLPLVVPCHRVLGAAGRLGGYSAPQGLSMKRRLLALEGSAS